MAMAVKITWYLSTVRSCIDLSVRIVTKSPKLGHLLIFSNSLELELPPSPDPVHGDLLGVEEEGAGIGSASPLAFRGQGRAARAPTRRPCTKQSQTGLFFPHVSGAIPITQTAGKSYYILKREKIMHMLGLVLVLIFFFSGSEYSLFFIAVCACS
jgi:hypothetical protein